MLIEIKIGNENENENENEISKLTFTTQSFNKKFCYLEEKEEKKEKNKNEMREETIFSELPDEMVLEIFTHLDPASLFKCSLVCQRFNLLSNDNLIWRNILEKNTNIFDFKKIEFDPFYYRFQIKEEIGIKNYFQAKEEEKRIGIEEDILDQIQNQPKELMKKQILILREIIKKIKSERKNQSRKSTLQNFVEKYFLKVILFSTILGIHFLPNLLACLRADEIIKGSWFFVFIPLYISITLFSIFSDLEIFLSRSFHDSDFLLYVGIGVSGWFLLIFFIILPLKLDNSVDSPLILFLIPFFLFSIIMIYFIVLFFKKLKNPSDFWFYLAVWGAIALGILCLDIFLILTSIKIDYNSSIKWEIVFIPLFAFFFIFLIAFIVIFFLPKAESGAFFFVLVCGVLILTSEIMTLTNLLSKTSIFWIYIYLPILIPSFVLVCASIIISFR
ncbi:f-box only protein [Anaeramoeba ignava]|uniref:F-box only protein n=1 Tax=Anaeramoeba ignava TaxID=1746090 RepID=A0A9Q0R6J3_ANAIG|nr:f-box only protein [Anaeramoeba ignava]